MKVEVLQGLQVIDPVSRGKVGELIPHTNKITGKPDPMIVYAPGFFVHMSTVVRNKGWTVRNAETKEPVTVDNLSEW